MMMIIVLCVVCALVFTACAVNFLRVDLLKTREQRCNIFSVRALDDYIDNVLKKRKNINLRLKNDIKTIKRTTKYSYKPINIESLNFCSFVGGETKNLLFPEKQIVEHKDDISKILTSGVKSKSDYRAIKSRVIIVELAKAYVFLTLENKNFDMVAHFRSVVKNYVVYKKEILVLPRLVKYFFALEIQRAWVELENIRRVFLLARIDKISLSKKYFSDTEVYALAKTNSKFHQVALKSGIDTIGAVLRLSKKMLELNSRIKHSLLWTNEL